MWSDKERLIAKTLTEPETKAFLKKVFVDLREAGGHNLAKNIVALDDAEYGRLMKVVHLTGEENKHRLNLITQIANGKPKTEGKSKTSAPR